MSETTPQDSAAMSPASTGSVEPVAWAALRDDGTVYACHADRGAVAAVAADRQIVPLWLRSRDSVLSPEPVAYCVETPLHGWEIASADAAAQEPELRWRKMTTLTDAEREAVATADAYMSAAGCRNTNVQDTLRGLLERLK